MMNHAFENLFFIHLVINCQLENSYIWCYDRDNDFKNEECQTHGSIS